MCSFKHSISFSTIKKSCAWQIASDFQGTFRGVKALGTWDTGRVWLCFGIPCFNPFDPPESSQTWLWRTGGYLFQTSKWDPFISKLLHCKPKKASLLLYVPRWPQHGPVNWTHDRERAAMAAFSQYAAAVSMRTQDLPARDWPINPFKGRRLRGDGQEWLAHEAQRIMQAVTVHTCCKEHWLYLNTKGAGRWPLF